ncbi:DUF4158 domain-containing protein [Thermoflavimicrobium daqui]|uniref:DUF4158 domain-containing protein n=1 Tax=Thermoflavimicrobium daqui TaxID=2137476 RepID=A0A364K1Q1_9BACL|nr:DUF4158 domain-containing protein [Thermoflavimicrobium daqui]RAL21956.1 hypothetical protein DL897_15330 [Thermoflavimicrobium daqui]
MPSIQDTIYPRIKSNLTDKDLEEAYTPQREEVEWAERKTRGNFQQLALLVLLKTTQKLGFFTTLLDVPKAIIEHIAQVAYLPIPQEEEWQEYNGSRRGRRSEQRCSLLLPLEVDFFLYHLFRTFVN